MKGLKPRLVFVDEWAPTDRKKERAKLKYRTRMARQADETARERRTRQSDISAPRITDGIPAGHINRVHRRPENKRAESVVDMTKTLLDIEMFAARVQ